MNKTKIKLYKFGDTGEYRVVVAKYGFPDDVLKSDNKSGCTDDLEVERISFCRTKRNLESICLCNNFDYFFTMTTNDKVVNRFSLDECQEKIKKIMKAYRRKNKDFKYIFITEECKKGGFHFHGFIKGADDNDFFINNNGFLDHSVFNTLGYCSFIAVDRDRYVGLVRYCSKYITKDCIRNSHNQIYFCSKGLKKAEEFYLNEIPGDVSTWWDNDFCYIKDFHNVKDLDTTFKIFIDTNKD